MELVVPTCEKIGEMFILILAGILSCKAGLLDEAMSKKLSNLLLMVVCPCLIINSYQIDYRPELFTGWCYACCSRGSALRWTCWWPMW